ncbi:MAG: TIGR04063 family PEP-CTERM/XrtA system glycosyltransferase [Burkholderiales bacterium]
MNDSAPLRILHVLDHSIPLHSGYTFRTAALLREQRALGWQTFHLTSPKHGGGSAAEETVEDLHFYRTPWQAEGWLDRPVARELALMRALERRLDDVVDRTRPDILHAHSPVLDAIPAIRVGRRRGIPVVYEVRAFWEDAAVDHGTAVEGGPRYRATRALETWALRQADAVTCICEGLRGDIVARGIAPDKVTVIPNAVDVDEFPFAEPPDEDLRRRLNLEGKLVVGFLGSFYAYEGLDLLLDALALLAPDEERLRVLLVGGGPQDAALREQARRLGIEDRVVFTGRVPHAEVARYYSLVDVLAYPRRSMRLTELVTPLKPLEAMAQGRLLVASDVGGHRELIRDGDTGILFPPNDARELAHAIRRLLEMRGGWETMREAGRNFVEKTRTWRRSVANYVPIFSRLRAEEAR